MSFRLAFRPFALTVQVWRFTFQTWQRDNDRARVFVVRLGGKVHRMRIKGRRDSTPPTGDQGP